MMRSCLEYLRKFLMPSSPATMCRSERSLGSISAIAMVLAVARSRLVRRSRSRSRLSLLSFDSVCSIIRSSDPEGHHGAPVLGAMSVLMVRTAWQLEHITCVSVRTPSGRTSTPLRNLPPVTAVAAKRTPRRPCRAVVSGASTSSMPAALTCSTWWRETGQKRAWISPPRQRRAAAVMMPSIEPPMPMVMSHAALADGGGDAGRDVAVGDELEPGPGAPDLSDQVLVPRPVEHHHDEIRRRAAQGRGHRCGCCRPPARRCRPPPAARPATISFCMYISGTGMRLPCGPGRDHRQRALRPAGQSVDAPPAAGPRASQTAGPRPAAAAGLVAAARPSRPGAPPSSSPGLQRRRSRAAAPAGRRPVTCTGISASASAMASRAASSPASPSPRPIHSAAPSAAASVTTAKRAQMQRPSVVHQHCTSSVR